MCVEKWVLDLPAITPTMFTSSVKYRDKCNNIDAK